jgi:ParB-like chromosome segregation protein Spo0J
LLFERKNILRHPVVEAKFDNIFGSLPRTICSVVALTKLRVTKPLVPHPVALLFPELPASDYEALKEDIRRHGVKVPILVHGGQILDGRHRYRACRELGIRCLVVEWNGHDPWLEVQSRNLVRRHLAKDQVYAIRKLAAQQFPELAAPIHEEREKAKARKAQAKGKPRGHKTLLRSQDRHSESADAIGAQMGVSGTTVKRVDRLAREAPELLPKVAAGELSVKKALRDLTKRAAHADAEQHSDVTHFSVNQSAERLERMIRAEWRKWPRLYRTEFLRTLQQQFRKLIGEHTVNAQPRLTEPTKPGAAVGLSH